MKEKDLPPGQHKLPFKSSRLTLNADQRPSYGVG